MNPRVIRTSGPVTAMAGEIAAAFDGLHPAAVMLFASDGEALAPLSQELGGRFVAARIMGCSSAGGFAFGSYDSDGVVAIGLPSAHFAVSAVPLRGLHDAAALQWMGALRSASEGLGTVPGRSRFGILLIDGLSQREELVSAMIDATLPGLLVLGGSAGDGLRFGRTHLALDGRAVDGAVFCLMETDFRIEEVIFDHISPTPTRLVITDARPEERLILEIDAEPAADEYARLIGAVRADLGPAHFAEFPLLVRIGGQQFVRAISGVTEGGGLRLMSSVATGEVMTIGRAEDLTFGLEERLSRLEGAALILGFDCILRRIALERAGQQGIVARLYHDYNVAGFNTYGEQHRGIHVNHTFVGLAFLPPEVRA
ncbi:FIST N-terminal domain-containing protein [Cereibacter sp. SYSU M97828]|nr:FIST N-terminal domain-containing protein [Cereibacter flavus]